MKYAEKLKDPRWQKKRLKILERDGWKCNLCKCDADTLHIHHLEYTSKDPWDEPNKNLITLCKYCHDAVSIDGLKDVNYSELSAIKFKKGSDRLLIIKSTDGLFILESSEIREASTSIRSGAFSSFKKFINHG